MTIYVPIANYHETEVIVKLYIDCSRSLKLFEELHKRICEDYSALIGQDVELNWAIIETRTFDDYRLTDITNAAKKYKLDGNGAAPS